MAQFRSASIHVAGSQPIPPDEAARLSGLSGSERFPRVVGEDEVPGPTAHALSRPKARRRVAPAWALAGLAGAVLLALTAWGSHDLLSARSVQAFPCPPGTSDAVQAATGCAVPAAPPLDGRSLDGEDEE